VLWHLQTHQACVPTYILNNVPLLGDTRSHVMANVHQIRSWIGPAVLLDVAKVGSCAHRPRLWWTNLLSREVLRRAYETIPRFSHLIVFNILDIGRHSQVVQVVDRSPLAMVNRVGQPRWCYPHLSVFQHHMPIERVVLSLYGILVCSNWWNPTPMRESVQWGFL
jgi:hypothetical protein